MVVGGDGFCVMLVLFNQVFLFLFRFGLGFIWCGVWGLRDGGREKIEEGGRVGGGGEKRWTDGGDRTVRTETMKIV